MPFTLSGIGESELLIKKSRFLGAVQPVADREEALNIVRALRAEHPASTHVCWALMAGGHSAAHDDGEPSGTAGRPMLEVLRHQELEGVLATVVRYYGGIQLGAGGLVRAYTDSVAQALKTLEKVPLVRRSLAEGTVPYEWEGVVRRLLGNHGAQLKDVQHGSTVRMVISVTADQLQTMLDALNESTQGQSQWRVLETVDRATR